MSDFIYAIAAVVAVMLFSISLRQTGLSSEQEMYVTEARSRMLGVARETVERVSRMDLPFDANTDPDRIDASLVFPYIGSASQLTSPNAFGGCYGTMSACLDLDDFDGFAVSDSAMGMPYDLGIEVQYVDTLDGSPSGSRTFAKELKVSVSTSAVRIAGQPLSVSYTRIYAYPSVMDFARGVETL